jgi:nucleotide-binding universal stress UspA family protein
VHEAPCPVLVARPGVEPGAWPRTIAVGVDGSPQAGAALAVAVELATRVGSPLIAVAAEGGKPLDVDGMRYVDTLRHDQRPPVEALVAVSHEADLLVIGSRGLHGLRAMGSVSERVAHRAACSVLVVRPLAAPAGEPRAELVAGRVG